MTQSPVESAASQSVPPCRGCGQPLTKDVDSKAHVIPSALGGRLKPKGLLCRTCNGRLDRLADNDLVAALGFWSTFLGISRDRGDNPDLLWTAADGTQYWMGEGGNIELRKAYGKLVTEGEVARFEIRSPNMKLLRNKLGHLKSKIPDLDIQQIESDAIRTSERLSKALKQSVEMGPARTFRGAFVILWLFCLAQTGKLFAPWGRLIEMLEGDDTLGLFCYVTNPEVWLIGPDIEVAHRLVLKSDNSKRALFGYVDLFGVLRVGGIIAKDWDDDVEEVYAYDLIKCEDVSGRFTVSPAFSALDIDKPGLRFKADHTKVMAEVSANFNRLVPTGMARLQSFEINQLVSRFVITIRGAENSDGIDQQMLRDAAEALNLTVQEMAMDDDVFSNSDGGM